MATWLEPEGLGRANQRAVKSNEGLHQNKKARSEGRQEAGVRVVSETARLAAKNRAQEWACEQQCSMRGGGASGGTTRCNKDTHNSTNPTAKRVVLKMDRLASLETGVRSILQRVVRNIWPPMGTNWV